jgi:amino acid adenylation domain-containing protein
MSAAKRALLEKYLRGDLSHSAPESRVIARRDPDKPALPSLGQEQLWIHAQLTSELPIYNEPVTVRRTGPIDLPALKQSLNEIIRRHEAWRTNFATENGQLVQVINPPVDFDLPVADLRGLDETEREAEAMRLATMDARRPFQLNQGPLLRALLVHLSDDDHRLYLTLHQIIFDGVSLYSVFLPELSALYEAFVKGQPSPLPELPIQYADFADWQRRPAQNEAIKDELAYWRQQLAGAPTALELPTEKPRPPIQTYNGEQLSFILPQGLSEELKVLSRREGTTLFMTLLAAFQIVLHRYTQQDDLLVGTVTTSRKRSEFNELLGFFLNTLVLRTDLSGEPSFRDLLARVRQVTVDALAHGDVPVHQLVKELERERDLSRNPLFQVMFVLEPPLPAPGPGWELSQVEVDAGIARVDLYLELDDRPEGLVGRIRYNCDLFEAASVEQLLSHFRTLLAGVVTNPERAISDYPLLTETERTRNLNNTVQPLNSYTPFARAEIEQSITERFASQVSKHPQRIAVKSRTHELSYEELSRSARQVAQAILKLQGADEERIALLFEHDSPMIAALLGTLQAGKTYVPLDPLYPQERLEYILADSQASALLTNDRNYALAQKLAGNHVQLINIDRLNATAESAAELPTVSPDRLAYILYTSGSTGQPKGVMQNHRNVLHYIQVYTNNLHLNADDRLTLLSSYCFDASVMDIYGALLNGATLCPIDIREEGLDGLSERLADEAITVYHSTPTVYRYFLNTLPETASLATVRLVVLGGEEVKRADVELYQKHFSDDCLFVNGLGPTEATVCLQNFIDKQTAVSGESVPVGFPVAATEVLLLNEAGRPSEIFGEIAIKSEHVALGYWRNPEATAAAFSSKGAQAARIYKTGDMGRRLADGSIKFEGRKDFQIKIRGFRVELGEIEATLAQQELVGECIVVAKDNAAGDKRLVAYVVPRRPTSINGELRAFLKQKLPDYMVPSSFVVLDSLPLTASGKLNRRALPAPDQLLQTKHERQLTKFVAAQTQTEKLLVTIWADLLETPKIGINDNFFEAGGHSLLAVRLFCQIQKHFGRNLPLATLFQAPTIAQLAAILEQDQQGTSNAEWSSLVAITPVERIRQAGRKQPFFCVHALGGNVLEYYDLANHLGQDQPFYGLQSAGLKGKHGAHTRVEDMAAHYIKEMRELQPRGPYFIGGRSLGGMIAFEMARQLRADGQEVGLLALLDTYPSGYAKLLRDQSTLRARFDRALSRTRAHLANLKGLSLTDKVFYLGAKSKFAPRKMKSQLWRRVYSSFENLGRPLPRALQDIQELNSMAVREYVPQVYNSRITLFWASSDLRAAVDFVGGWRALAGGGIDVHEIPGTHLDIIKEPHVTELARKLSDCLERAQKQRPPTSAAA